MDKVLYDYYNPKYGFQSAEKLDKKLLNDGYSVTLSAVKSWINKQDTQQQYKQVKIIKKYFPIVSPNDLPFELLQIDLLAISNLAGSNHNVNFLLAGIDVHTRFAFVLPLKNKLADTINNAIEPVLKETKCKYIECDSGSEFIDLNFKNLLKNIILK